MSDDSQTLALIGSAKSPIKVTCGEYEGRRNLDIRRHYFDKTSKQLRPTTKGIAVARDNFKELLNVLEQNKKTIEDWLDGEGELSSDAVAQRNDRANKAARLNAKLAAVPVDVVRELWKGASFFSCSSAGGKDVVSLNEGHPLLAALKDVEEGRRTAEELLGCVIIAFAKAKNIFQGSDEPFRPEEVFDVIEFNWGLYLSKCLKTNS